MRTLGRIITITLFALIVAGCTYLVLSLRTAAPTTSTAGTTSTTISANCTGTHKVNTEPEQSFDVARGSSTVLHFNAGDVTISCDANGKMTPSFTAKSGSTNATTTTGNDNRGGTTTGNDLYTNIHPFGMGECNPLSAGVPYVWKDYVRSEQLVKIFAHDGRGEEGSKICRDVYDWGWRAAWDGFRTYEGAKTYALEEADRVLNSKDANPAFVGKDPVKKIVVYNGNTILKTIDVR